ncbi:MAG: hypothetical protein ABS81_01555 [Pseudonocardia sp. SCN 72-86]|nr:MAG: hypothetical protein ABS81_01555 [Pseudonocardia sp. SCN 72-86]
MHRAHAAHPGGAQPGTEQVGHRARAEAVEHGERGEEVVVRAGVPAAQRVVVGQAGRGLVVVDAVVGQPGQPASQRGQRRVAARPVAGRECE